MSAVLAVQREVPTFGEIVAAMGETGVLPGEGRGMEVNVG